MNIQSNTYTFIYSTIIVLVVATILSIASATLKTVQKKNIEIEKKQNILYSARIQSDKKNAQKLFDKYITQSFTINFKGDIVQKIDPFVINLRDELKKTKSKRNLPAFVCKKNDSTFLIIPVYGKGLWGPIWGYVSFFKEDKVTEGKSHYNTIYGTLFDHKGETPGLGAEINQPFFQNSFKNKQIYTDKNEFVSIKVVKGKADKNSPHQVDAISGGTITSKGLEAMLDTCLSSYQNYFKLRTE